MSTPTETPEQIASRCVTHCCPPDDYDKRVHAAIAAAIQAERDRADKAERELAEAVRLVVKLRTALADLAAICDCLCLAPVPCARCRALEVLRETATTPTQKGA